MSVEKRIDDLETEFISWSNLLDKELLKYSYSLPKFSNSDISIDKYDLLKLYHRLLEYNDEYKVLKGAKYTHPNYEKSISRLDHILDIICDEVDSRKSKLRR